MCRSFLVSKDYEKYFQSRPTTTDYTGFVLRREYLDLYSRYILSWRLSSTMEASFCLEMLQEGLNIYPAPWIINTDQGVQFTSQAWIDCVEAASIKVSMDGKGRWADNVHIERFWRTIKYEHIFLQDLKTLKEARESIRQFMVIYNTVRLHQSLGYKTPWSVYQSKGQ